MSQVEILPNELFVEIFQFLSIVDLLHAFWNLNDRFNRLIYFRFQNNSFSFQSIHKQHFDLICDQHEFILPTNINSFHLCNDEETTGLCELFLISGLNLDRFIHLQSLKLSHVDSFRTLNQLIVQCHHLLCLQKLDLIDCQCINGRGNNSVILIDHIWSLPNLTHCVINNIKVNMTWVYQISIICSTLESLSIGMIEGDKSALYHLCKSIPNIRRLNIDLIQWSFYYQPKILFPFVIELKTAFQNFDEPTREFLRSLPNLTSLTLDISNILLTGNDWQTLVENSLPKLTILRFKMNCNFTLIGNLITVIDQLVASYRTPFWLKEHQWYIRCDCYLAGHAYRNVLYTLPYTFDQCEYLNTYYSIATEPNDDQRYSHDRVQLVDQRFIRIDSMQNLKLFNIRFPNVRQMDIHFPWMDYSDSFDRFSSFQQLKSLTVTLNDAFSYEQLQTFLHYTPRLYALKFISLTESIERFFQLRSSSIRRLDLNFSLGRYEFRWKHQNCMNLIHSPLGRQCEVLLINLERTNDIVELIEKMPHLRVIICQIGNDNSFRSKIFSSRSTKLMKWLRKSLPPKCSITMNSEEQQQLKISIWINRTINSSAFSNDQTSISTDRAHLLENSNRIYLSIFLFFFFAILFCYLFI